MTPDASADLPRVALDFSYLRVQAGGAMNYAGSFLRTLPAEVAGQAVAVVSRSAADLLDVPSGLHTSIVPDPFRGRIRAREVISRSRADVIHWTGNFALPVRGRGSVVSVHDFMSEHYRSRGFAMSRSRLLQARLVQRSVARADVVITHDPLHHAMVSARRRRGEVVLAPLGPGPWVAERSGSLPEALAGRPFVLVLGTDGPHKRIAELVRLVLASPRCRDVRVAHTADPLGIDDPRLVELGRVDAPTLASLMENTAALVMPSSYEGFGMPVLEAAIFGAPVLATPGCPAVHAGAEFSRVEVRDALEDFPEALAGLLTVDAVRRGPEERESLFTQCWSRYHEGHLTALRIASA